MLALCRILFLLSIILLSISDVTAQLESCDCKSDIEFLHQKIKKTPSYRNNKEKYNKAYKVIINEASIIDSAYDCFLQLNKLLLSLNDNHSKVYGIDKGATKELRDAVGGLEKFKQSKLYKLYTKITFDLDSLTDILALKSPADKEGIYTNKDNLKIGVRKNQEVYEAIVLSSESEIWSPGELIYTMIPYGNDYLLSVGGNSTSKRLIAYTERIEDGTFLTMGYQKDISKSNYTKSIHPDTTYLRKEISSDISYIKVGSFNSWYPTLSDAEDFYASLKNNLTKSNLIIDLRDNGGGGNRNSDILHKIIKDYLKKSNVYLITNHRTASNAEQFAYKLKENPNCITFGQRTNGSVTYEIVDKNYNLPCENYLTVLTSKKHSKYSKLESKGLDPDWILNMDNNWMVQVVDFINNQ